MEPTAAKPELAEMHEVGFLLAETDEAVQIGMELGITDMHPGRWRLSIPKSAIIERRDMPLARMPKSRKKT